MEANELSGVSQGIGDAARSAIEEATPAKIAAAIGISISNSPDLDRLGFTELHIQDAMVELARYLLVANCKLVYGGDLREGGYTFLFSQLANQYTQPRTSGEFMVENYFAWPIHVGLSKINEYEFRANKIRIIMLDAPPGTPEPNVFLKPETKEAKVIWAKSLTGMRNTIANVTRARVVIGGPVADFKGLIPGLVEEALIAIRHGQPLYLCGAFGGAVGAIIAALRTGKAGALDESFQCKDSKYKEFYEHWNNTESPRIDYQAITRELQQLGLSGLSKLNGLTDDENIRLFGTPHIPEMIFLILKGLKAKEVLT